MKINFLGDVGVFKMFEVQGIDPFREIQLPDADLNIANFEFIVSKKREKQFYDVQEQYSCSYEYLEKLFVQRFDGYGLANNHSLDYGLDGAADVMGFLKDAGREVFGFSMDDTYSVGSFERNGIKIGIIAFVKSGRWSKDRHGFGPDSYDVEKICSLIKQQRNQYNHTIVYPHWGTELVEIPDTEDAVNARKFIDAGATAVIGHHPHISQGIETYRNGLIAYSLGSFIYIPDQELGYSKSQKNRDISICLQIELDEQRLMSHTAHYYRYQPQSLIPEPIPFNSVKDYAEYLNQNIHNYKIRRSQIRKGLIRREINSFWQRLKSRPIQTIVNYVGILHPKKLKKLIR